MIQGIGFSGYSRSIAHPAPRDHPATENIDISQLFATILLRGKNVVMSNSTPPSLEPSRVISIILGGGSGRGLFPLTRDRATPAVPLAGSYRVIDIPLSNCLNSGLRQIYVLTQFNSVSLHRHVSQAYKFDQFSDGFLEILAAQQTMTDTSWYQGTADAVRKNFAQFLNHDFDYALVLSADHLYRMDFRPMLDQHVRTGADLTIGAVLVGPEKVSRFGILTADQNQRVSQFVEKPTDPGVLAALQSPAAGPVGKPRYLASMGIYVFSRRALERMLDCGHADFAREIIPAAIENKGVFAYLFDGYWEDIGNLRSFFDANLELVSELPRFNLFDMAAPFFSLPLYLPGAKVNHAKFDHALVAAGCIIEGAEIHTSVIGLRSVIGAGSQLRRVVLLGADLYESQESILAHQAQGIPRIGIGRNARIENAIIDRNARIGDDVVLRGDPARPDEDHDSYSVRDGLVIVARHGVIPNGTVI